MVSTTLRVSAVTSLIALSLATPLSSRGQSGAQYSPAELRRTTPDTATPDQVRAQAGWIRQQESECLSKAAREEKLVEYYRTVTLPGKYPTPGETATSLRDYYLTKAHQWEARAKLIESRLTVPEAARAIADPTPGLSQSERTMLERIEELERQVRQLREKR